MDSIYVKQNEAAEADDFEVLEVELLPPVNEFKRFAKVFFNRKIVVFGFILLVRCFSWRR
jgi:hypothetical protein